MSASIVGVRPDVDITNLPFGPDYPYATANTIDGDVASFVTPTGDTFLVDAADFEYVSQCQWWAQAMGRTTYVARAGRPGEPRTVTLHRDLLHVTDRGLVVDHINRDGLDNRRANLRPCTHSQNHGNAAKQRRKSATSRYKGVCWHRSRGWWQATITVNGIGRYLGHYATEAAAAAAYNAAAREGFGDFALLNDVDEPQAWFLEVAAAGGCSVLSEAS